MLATTLFNTHPRNNNITGMPIYLLSQERIKLNMSQRLKEFYQLPRDLFVRVF